jgi:hypothetical protein
VFKTGEVVRFKSDIAGKTKYHLCISMDDHFIFLNSPKSKSFVGDFEIDASDIVGIPPTPEGKSIASCSIVMQFTKQDLIQYNATCVGTVKPSVLKSLLLFVENLTTIEAETKNQIIDGLGDTVGF